MRKFEIHPETYVCLDGVSYSLVREVEVTQANPCELCDLKYVCCADMLFSRYNVLCTPRDGSESWFFRKNQRVTAKGVKDLITRFSDADETVRGLFIHEYNKRSK